MTDPSGSQSHIPSLAFSMGLQVGGRGAEGQSPPCQVPPHQAVPQGPGPSGPSEDFLWTKQSSQLGECCT